MATMTKSKRQLVWVYDLNKCIGCQTCSVACKVLWTHEEEGAEHQWWMTVNTQPGAGTPKDWEKMGGGYDGGKLQLGKLPTAEEFGGGWDYNYDEVLRGGRGREVYLQKTAGSKSWGMNWDEDEGGGEYPNAYFFYLPRMCNHCTEPACVEACPSGAMFKREEDGLVLRDEDICQGAQDCARACPYKKIYFNATAKVSQHCIGCFPRLEQGVAPACVRQCPGRAAFVGFKDDAGSAVFKLVEKWKVALPLHPEYGTEANVYLRAAAGAGAASRGRELRRGVGADSALVSGGAVRSRGPRCDGRAPHGARQEASRSGLRADGPADPVPLAGLPRTPEPRSRRHRLEVI